VSRILAYTSPTRGHLFPLTPILDELAGRGHEVHVRTLASQVPMLRERGLHAAPIDPEIESMQHDDWKGRNPREALKIAVAGFAERARVDAPDLEHAIAAVEPDALIVDVNCWGALAVAEGRAGAWASFCPYPLPLSSPDAPPFGPGLPPARGPLGRMRDRMLRPIVLGSVLRTFLPRVNEVRAAHRLAAVGEDFMVRAPLVLYMTAEPFEYPRRNWPANVKLIGPCTWDPPADPPPWLVEIGRPLVLVTTSSEFQDDARLVSVALAALAEEAVDVVATLPAQDPAGIDVPANARVLPFVPHGPVIERAVCVVTHGGMGATQKALARGVPVCAVPFGRDQLEVARRVEVAGAGTRLAANRIRADRLRDAVRRAMECRPGAQRIAAAFAAAGGPTRAADLYEGLLAASPVAATAAAISPSRASS
jgi:MGT family glycosyltransferase